MSGIELKKRISLSTNETTVQASAVANGTKTVEQGADVPQLDVYVQDRAYKAQTSLSTSETTVQTSGVANGNVLQTVEQRADVQQLLPQKELQDKERHKERLCEWLDGRNSARSLRDKTEKELIEKTLPSSLNTLVSRTT